MPCIFSLWLIYSFAASTAVLTLVLFISSIITYTVTMDVMELKMQKEQMHQTNGVDWRSKMLQYMNLWFPQENHCAKILCMQCFVLFFS